MTIEVLNKISPAMVGVRGINIANAINEIFPLYGMMEVKILQATIPNLLHESAEFTRFEENLNYSVLGLIKGFGRHRISINQANLYGRIDGKRTANKQAIANTIYGGNWGRVNLGNTSTTDGWDLRGSGGLQGTGRAVLSGFTHYYNKRFNSFLTVQSMAAKLRDVADLKMTMHFACWFLSEFKNLLPLARSGRFSDFVRGINGGLKGIEDRMKYYNRALVHIK